MFKTLKLAIWPMLYFHILCYARFYSLHHSYLALSRSFSHFGICERVCVRVYFLSFSGTYNEHPN